MSAETKYGLFTPHQIGYAPPGAHHLWERLRAVGSPNEIAMYDQMLQRTEEGFQRFEGFTLDVLIVNSGLYACRESRIGVREFFSRVYLLGDHYRNGIGIRHPAEKAKNPYGQDESIAFAVVRSIDYNPGQTYAYLPVRETHEYVRAERIYQEFLENGAGAETVDYVLEEVGRLRDQRSRQLIPIIRDISPVKVETPLVATAAD